MKHQVFLKAVLCCALVVLVISSVQVSAQESARPSRPRRGGLYGDWQVKISFGERQMDSILTFSRDREGNRMSDRWTRF
jgi:hypothetical protein